MKVQWLLVALALPQYDSVQERRRTTGLTAYCAAIAALQLIWGSIAIVAPEAPGSPAHAGTAGPAATSTPPTTDTDDSIKSWNVTGVTSEARRHRHSGAPSEQDVSARGGQRRGRHSLDDIITPASLGGGDHMDEKENSRGPGLAIYCQYRFTIGCRLLEAHVGKRMTSAFGPLSLAV